MQIFMSFYFWTLHLIWWLIYSEQRLNLWDCNEPEAQPWYGRSQQHAILSLSSQGQWLHTRLHLGNVTSHHLRYRPWGAPRTQLFFPLGFHQRKETLLPSSLNVLPVPSPASPHQCWETQGFVHSQGWEACVLLHNARSTSKGCFPSLV